MNKISPQILGACSADNLNQLFAQFHTEHEGPPPR